VMAGRMSGVGMERLGSGFQKRGTGKGMKQHCAP
jgi:hypothetical protein